MSATAVRILTRDPVKALEVAQCVQTARDEPWVSDVMIFKLDEDREYTMFDFQHLADQPFDNTLWMYMAWRAFGGEVWREKFNKTFAETARATTPA